MTEINVVFDVPEHILRGLAEGTLERVGGVIRHTEGKKEVCAWLTEISTSSEKANDVIGEKLSNVLAQQQLAVGLEVANLAVNVVGFAVIYQKLQSLERQIQGLDQKLGLIKQGQDWLDKKHFIEQLSPVIASLRSLQSAHRISDSSVRQRKILDADQQCIQAQTYFDNVVEHLLSSTEVYRYVGELKVSYKAWIMAAQGAVQAMAALGETAEALSRATDFKNQHADFGKRLRATLGDHVLGLLAEGGGEKARKTLSDLGKESAAAHHLLRGQTLQLEYLNHHGVDAADLALPGAYSQSAFALCVPGSRSNG